MARRVRAFLSRRAERDLLEIYRYLSEHSPQALKKIDDAMFRALRRLEAFPRSGHWVKELSSRKYREVLVYHYRVIYRHLEKEKRVHIFTIRHGKRFLPTIL